VAYTATVTSANVQPTGVVRFLADGVLYGPTGVLCEPSGGNSCTAELRATPLPAGNHTITAEYLGDANFLASTGTLAGGQTVVEGGVFEFAQAAYTVAERGGSVRVTVVRNGDTSLPVAVDYTTDDGSSPAVFVPCSATAGAALDRCDYERASGTLHFAAGEREQRFTVLINDDSYVEGAETTTLRLSNPTGGAALASTPTATLEITDDVPESTGNPLDDDEAFIAQHYRDFLNREPDPEGLKFWTDGIKACGADAQCREVRRINTSAAFFLSIEFQQTGYLVHRMHKAAAGNLAAGTPVPIRLDDFLRDTQRVGLGVVVGSAGWEQRLAENKAAFALAFVQRPEFLGRYPAATDAAAFVDALDEGTGGVLTSQEKSGLVAELLPNPADAARRASVLRKVAEHPAFAQSEFNRAFVLMEYIGYLRRDPEAAPDTNFGGYLFWLMKLDSFGGDFVRAEMVKAFISSDEYRQRFGQ
jgi:hypothetical protein